jgi:predicted secreted protein
MLTTKGNRAIFLTAIAVLFCFGTISKAYTYSAPMPEKKQATLKVTEKENGKKVYIAKGDLLSIKLETQPGTGYGWEIAKYDSTRTKLVKDSVQEGSGSGMPGGVEHYVFLFKALTRGSAELKLIYVRSWEKEVEPAKTFSIKLQIRKK